MKLTESRVQTALLALIALGIILLNWQLYRLPSRTLGVYGTVSIDGPVRLAEPDPSATPP